ncbi:MAG: allB [Verrucomicrobia bacterium]|nr:allB [Verrucomicrobiota bacterium]
MSSRFDVIVRGGRVVTPEGVTPGDVGIAGEKIAHIAVAISESAPKEIDASGLQVFPGILDAHVHFNEPGRTEWEGLATGSAALAAGGGAWFCDMPLNSTPPVLDAASFAAKASLAAEKSVTDFSLWGGLVPQNVDRLAELAEAGVIGVKAFMCGSGVADFPGITDEDTLRRGMRRAAELGLLVAVHAEDEGIAERLTAAARAEGRTDIRSWLDTRPLQVELAAIRLATDLAGETNCPLHIVHVSSPEGLAIVADARRHGVKVSAETCPHYLLLNEADALRIGAAAKCAPPLRPEASRRGLWDALGLGWVDTIGSDHSPAPPALKTAADFFDVWGGISGIQHGFPLLLGTAVERLGEHRALTLFSMLLAADVARRFQLPGKGRLAVGADADFTLLDLRHDRTLDNSELLYRHRQGPYHGRRCRCTVKETWVRGARIWRDGGIAPGARRGQLLRPNSAAHA